jgi:uncharacterized caspase-like protein
MTGPQGQAAERVALVIGNSAYEGAMSLRNPGADADAIAAALRTLDFAVIEKKDLDLAHFEQVVVDFRRRLSKDGLALFYYAGHGIQVRGENYLVPIGAMLREEFEVKRQCLEVGLVIDAMAESQARLKVLVLDCCRENPFKRGWSRGSSAQGMAATSTVPEGTLISYSTSPNETAADGNGANSPYAEQLVAVLRSRPAEGLELSEIFRQASRAVKRQTGQVPWLHLEASLEKYYLWGSGVSSAVQPVAPPSEQKSVQMATAELALAQAKLSLAEKNWKRAQALLPSKAIAQNDYDSTSNEYDLAKANVDVAVAVLEQARNGSDFGRKSVPLAEAELAVARAKLRIVEITWKRAQALFSAKVISQSDYDAVLGDYSLAKANVGVAEAALEQARTSRQSAPQLPNKE